MPSTSTDEGVAPGRLPLQRPVIPYACIVGLALAATVLHPGGTRWSYVAGAAIVAAAGAVVALVVPWQRLPLAAQLSLAIWCDVVLALLRQAQGGIASGYAPVAILPVIWVALVMKRAAVVAIAAATGLLFGLPIVLVGGADYPPSAVRAAVLWTIVALVVGLIVQRVVEELRRQSRLAELRALELDRLVRTQTAIATSPFSVDDVLSKVVSESLELTGAEGAVVELPDGDEMVYRAVGGAAAPYLGVRLARADSLSGECLRLGEVLICSDAETDPRVDREACRRVGARSLLVVPLLHDGKARGVLKVYTGTAAAFGDAEARPLAALATVIASALARGELLDRLHDEATTDELTGIANRRHWHEQLDAALARRRRSGQALSVILLDLDGFKQVNDTFGHAAGDALLVDVATRWSVAVREVDVLGRIGGDEFAVLLDGADQATALEVTARLESTLPHGCGVSAGSATADADEDATSLLARADAAMYERKQASRTPPRVP
jgi:diguanylate cyclase (GGDEF)-like protein